MKSSGGGVGEDKSPDKEPKKKERSGGSIKKRLSIGYGFSSLRKRNPIKGVFEEEDRKKGKSIEIKVDDVGWKQTKHVGQEEAQQLKALMVLTKQLGEEDTDEIAQLLQEWDADKVQKEIEDKRRMQMQKNRSLQVVMEQWGRSGPERDAFPLPSDADGALSLSSPSAITLPAPTPVRPTTPGDSAADALTLTATIATLTSSAATLNATAGAPNNNADATAEQDQFKKKMMMTSAADDNKSGHHYDGYDGRRRGSSFDDSSPTWSVDDEYTADSSVIIEDDDEDLMEVPEIGSEGNDSEGSEGGGGRSPRTSSSATTKKKKKIREPRPPSMVFGKKENLDLRDWQTFLEAERARALPYAVNSPRRAASPRNSPRNSPAGFLIFKHKKMLTTRNSNNNASGQASPSSKLGSGGRHPTRPRGGSGGDGDDVSSDVRRTLMKGGGGGRAWSDDESSSYEQRRPGGGGGRGDIGDEVVELAEMSEGEGEETEGATFSHRRDSTSSRMSPTPTTPTKAGSPTIPKIVLTPQMQERTVKLPPPPATQSPTSPPRNGGADVSSAGSTLTSAATSTSPGRRRKAAGEQIRRISLSDSQLVFFQRWMRDKVKDGKVEVPADVEQDIRERERDAVRRYDKMEADGLRKALVKRDKELAVLRRAVEELKGREEKAAARERELRDEVRRERERADRVQARENVLKEMIREKVEEKRKMKEERERELELRRVSSSDDQHHQHHQPAPRRTTKENKKEKKEKEKGKSERKRRGSAIKFVGKEKGERERSSRAGGRLDSSGERAPEPIQHAAAAGVNDEVVSLQELVQKGAGTWSKSRGRHEVKIFKHLRSKSSEEVPTAYVAKESREAH